MRIGGSTPFNPSGAFPVALGPGSYSYIPPGNYLCSLGAQTCVEWWDPVQSAWRVVAWPNEQFPISVDGYNYRLINRSGVVVGASITNAGSGGTNGIGPTQTGAPCRSPVLAATVRPPRATRSWVARCRRFRYRTAARALWSRR